MKTLLWLIVLVAVAVSVAVLLQWRTVAGLRSENAALQSAIISPAGTQSAPDHGFASNEEVSQLRRENQDLPRLRNQARELRSQLTELAAAREENERLLQAKQRSAEARLVVPADPSQFTQKEALAEVGLATPEAAIQSFFRAMRDGDARRWLECVSNDFRNRRIVNPQKQPEFTKWGLQLREEMQMFRNFRIVERKDLSPEKVVLDLQSSEGPAVVQMPLVVVGGEWKVDPPF